MSNYIVFRILKGLIVVVLISIVTFAIMRAMPGDPIQLFLGTGEVELSQEQLDAIRAKWGLDKPLIQQYFLWAGNLLKGDLGVSIIRRGVPVSQMVQEALPITLLLNVYALILALLIAIPFGIWAAIRRNSMVDYSTAVASALGIATPNFWLSLMLIVLFALYIPRWIGEIPLIGRIPPFGLKTWQGYILPVIVLSAEQMAVFTRVMRGAIIEVLPQDFIRTARSKGVPGRRIVWRHAVSNALLPVITVIGFRIAFILSGTIIVETVFALPGIGRLFTDSVIRLDYQVVQSLVVMLAVIVVVVNLVTDLLYAVIDPRIRIS
ncbi:MAG: ABC transporter permease [Trueperaceae bacterium]|nr:ABC transporter permease [Trueperaceae bacterium]